MGTQFTLRWITLSGLVPFPGCQDSCDSFKWACRNGRFFQYTSELEVLYKSGLEFNTKHNYETTMLQLRPSLDHYVF